MTMSRKVGMKVVRMVPSSLLARKDVKRDISSGEKPAKHHHHLHLIVSLQSDVGVPDEVLSQILGADVFEP